MTTVTEVLSGYNAQQCKTVEQCNDGILLANIALEDKAFDSYKLKRAIKALELKRDKLLSKSYQLKAPEQIAISSLDIVPITEEEFGNCFQHPLLSSDEIFVLDKKVDEPNTELLRELGNHLLYGTLGHSVFKMGAWNHNESSYKAFQLNGCGEVGNAIGECPILFPDEWCFAPKSYLPVLNKYKWDKSISANTIKQSAIEFFNLTDEEFQHLFVRDVQRLTWGNKLTYKATAMDCGNNLIAFCQLSEAKQLY